MSGTGNRYDNSAVESLFKSMKGELIWRRNWQSRREAEVAHFEYINGFYNPRRKHSALGWKAPVVFEQQAVSRDRTAAIEPDLAERSSTAVIVLTKRVSILAERRPAPLPPIWRLGMIWLAPAAGQKITLATGFDQQRIDLQLSASL